MLIKTIRLIDNHVIDMLHVQSNLLTNNKLNDRQKIDGQVRWFGVV